jgi:hypothetical protein
MQGFTKAGDASEYVTALPALWNAADAAFSVLDAHFYEYGESYTNEFKSVDAIAYVKKEVLLERFYGIRDNPRDLTGGIRTKIKENSGQPFASVSEFTKTLTETNNLFVIVSDLYEQNQDDPFSRFYRDAFARGLSGAFFAVESSFSGEIHSISRVNVKDKFIPVRNGKSTFYICVAGENGAVYAYCAAFEKELKRNNLVFDDAVFIVRPIKNFNVFHGESVMEGSAKRFDLPENAYKMVNIRDEKIRTLGENAAKQYFESYQILTSAGSRWTAGLPLAHINPQNFSYKSEFALFFSEGSFGKQLDESTQFSGVSSQDITVKIAHISDIPEVARNTVSADCPLYVVAEAKNRTLSKGWHRIDYSVIPEAIPIPAWVSALNARDIPELEASVKDERVKTLQLANVYEKIAEAYNRTNQRSVYRDVLYLVKR